MTTPIHKPTNIKYLPLLNRVEPKVIDHSGLKLFKDCPRRYFFRVVLGLKTKKYAHKLNWGTCYHRFREVLEKEFNRTSNATDSMKAALQNALDWWDKNVHEPSIVDSGDKHLTKARFVLSAKASFDAWQIEKKLAKINVVAIEQSFSIILPDGTETCGRMDQIVRWSGRLWIRDFKTTKKAASFFERSTNPNDQATRYIYAASVLNGQPVSGALFDVLFNAASKGPEIFVKTTTRNEEQIKTWLAEQAYWTEQLIEAREKDIYAVNENQCGWCDYYNICSLSSEGAQLNSIKTNYKFDPWDPLNHGD